MAKREMKSQKVEEPIIEETVNDVAEEVVEEKIIPIGIVTNCSKLNIRKKASLKADVLTVLNAKTEVTIDPDYTNKEWYKIVPNNSDEVAGYCKKEFITIK